MSWKSSYKTTPWIDYAFVKILFHNMRRVVMTECHPARWSKSNLCCGTWPVDFLDTRDVGGWVRRYHW